MSAALQLFFSSLGFAAAAALAFAAVALVAREEALCISSFASAENLMEQSLLYVIMINNGSMLFWLKGMFRQRPLVDFGFWKMAHNADAAADPSSYDHGGDRRGTPVVPGFLA